MKEPFTSILSTCFETTRSIAEKVLFLFLTLILIACIVHSFSVSQNFFIEHTLNLSQYLSAMFVFAVGSFFSIMSLLVLHRKFREKFLNYLEKV